MKDRDEYFDFIRGVAIMMVVAIHTFPPVSGYNSFCEDAMLALRQIMNCAVPVFLAISGYFQAKKTAATRDDIFCFWKKQIPRVFIPMVVCGLGWFFLSLLGAKEPSDILILFVKLFSGAFSVYYFVTLILQCYIAFPILVTCNLGGVIFCFIISFLAVIATNFYMIILGNDLLLVKYAGPIYLWIVFFVLGIFMSKYQDRVYFKWGVVIAIAGFFLQVIESDYWLRIYGKGIGIKASSFIFSIGMILIILSGRMQQLFRTSKFTKAVAWIGEVSFGVYLIHDYWIAISSKLLKTENWAAMWFFSFAMTLFVITVMRKLIPAPVLKKYFGF